MCAVFGSTGWSGASAHRTRSSWCTASGTIAGLGTSSSAELLCDPAGPVWLVAPDCRGHGDSGWVGRRRLLPFLRLSARSRFPRCVISAAPVGEACGSFHGRHHRLPLRGHPSRARFQARAGRGPGAARDVVRRCAPASRAVAGGGPGGGGGRLATASPEEAAGRLRRNYPRLTEKRARHLARHGMRRTERRRGWQWKFDPLHRTTSPQPFYLEQFREFLRRVRLSELWWSKGAESEHRAWGDIQERHGWLGGRRARDPARCRPHGPAGQPRGLWPARIGAVSRVTGAGYPAHPESAGPRFEMPDPMLLPCTLESPGRATVRKRRKTVPEGGRAGQAQPLPPVGRGNR